MKSITDFKNVFFIGIAGVGMSAIAQYLQGIGKQVAGSDRYFAPNTFNDTKVKLESEGIACFLQDGSGITAATELVVVSTAIEDTVLEVQLAKKLNLPIIKRSELLALIAKSKKTIAVGGTSGKSTTSAMLFSILEHAGLMPSIISGAGLTSIIADGKIGNAKVGQGDWLVIEADESDGSIVQYHSEIGLLLNIDKDHQDITELLAIFGTFKNNSKNFITNHNNVLAKPLSANLQYDFSINSADKVGFAAQNFVQNGFTISFTLQNILFNLNVIGQHNMENAIAAVAVANFIGVPLQTCAEALANYQGIYRRNQILGQKNGIWVIDDYAHNPVKCAAAIASCQPVAKQVIAWFQPHGYGPTRFLKNDFIAEFSKVLRATDKLFMSEIFYAGGTAVKDISAKDLTDAIAENGKAAFFVADRNELLQAIKPHLTEDTVILLMGARDPSLETFSKTFYQNL
jgi:UDP-N-acetylmuramate--alanine ligase